MSPRPTLVSLAAALGVSRQTVSNVINAPERVNPATRERVEAEIRRTGYIPARAGRQLRTGRAQVIALRLSHSPDGISGAVLDRFLHAVVRSAGTRQHHVMILSAESDAAEVQELRTLHLQGEIDGAILHSTGAGDPRPEQLAAAGIPYASFGRVERSPQAQGEQAHPAAPWADVSGATGVRQATEALLREHRAPVGFIGWPAGSLAGDDRRSGWEKAILGHTGQDASEHPASLWAEAEESIAGGRMAAEQLYRRGARSFVCASDSLALGAYDFLHGRNLGDFSQRIIGFDNTAVARSMNLRSVDQPIEDVAEFLVSRLLEALSPEQSPHSSGAEAPSTIFPSTFS